MCEKSLILLLLDAHSIPELLFNDVVVLNECGTLHVSCEISALKLIWCEVIVIFLLIVFFFGLVVPLE